MKRFLTMTRLERLLQFSTAMSPGRWSAPPFEQSRRNRKRVEMLFAHLKRILRLGRLRLRGPRGAQDEFTLGLLRRTFAGLPSSLPDRRRQQSCAQRDQCRTSAPPLIKMPPASNGSPLYKGRSEELTTNIADFCNKICQ
jgi:hypothetical protein